MLYLLLNVSPYKFGLVVSVYIDQKRALKAILAILLTIVVVIRFVMWSPPAT